MKYIFLIFVLVAFVEGQVEKCLNETGVDEDLVDGIERYYDFVEDAKLKKYVYCSMKDKGVITENDEFDKEKYLTTFIPLRPDYKEVVDDCANVTKPTTEEYIWHINKCVTLAQMPGLLRDIMECIKETGPSKKLLKRMVGFDYSFDDDKIKAYVFCTMKKSRIIGNEGEFLKNIYLTGIELKESQDDYNHICNICKTDETRITDKETAWTVAKCLALEKNAYFEKKYAKQP